MQTWAKRGIQSALVTGGLLMLGTGIASAQENINPDAAPSTIDGGITVPIDVEHNSFSTPEDQREVPEFHREIDTNPPASTNPLVRNAGSRVDTSNATCGDVVQPNAVMPVNVCGNGVAAGKDAAVDTTCSQSVTQPDAVVTDGSNGSLAGNVEQPQLAGPVSVDDNAIAGAANSSATSSTANFAKAGGFTSTTGEGSTLSGNLADAPVALPVSGGGNAVSAVGNTAAHHTNDVTAKAGDGTYTNGDNSVLGANTVSASPASAVDVCGDAVAGAGNATALCGDDVTSVTDGYNGTTGNDSVVSANIAQAPAVAPAEASGLAAGVAGSPTSITDEHKVISSGGTQNSDDDNGTVSSNVVTAPTAIGAQVFADTDTAAANGDSNTFGVTKVVAGGDSTTSAQEASVSGNLAAVPANGIASVFGEPVTAAGIANTTSDSTLVSKDGGNTETAGNGSALNARDIHAPAEIAAQVYDIPVEVLDEATALVYTQTTQITGEEADATRAAEVARGIDLPVSVDSLLGANEVPNLSNLNRLPVGAEVLSTLPVNQLPSTDQPTKRDLPTQGLDLPATNSLHLPMTGDLNLPATDNLRLGLKEERSFGGTLPLGGGNFGFTPVIQGVLPLAPAGRTLPTVPAAPVALPTLPVVLPVAQPRALGTPALPTTSVNGLKLDATGDTLTATNNERTFPAPALAGLDTQSLFGSIEDTIQMPRI
jgi:hypothetical protein